MIRVLTIATITGVGVLAGGLGVLAGLAPASAFDDRPSTFGPLMSAIGVGGGDNTAEKGEIDFRERPPLVVPKALDLPAPRPGAATRAANWPQDQDIVRRREEAARARVPSQIYVNANSALDKRELLRTRSDDAPVAVQLCDNYVNGVPDCAPTAMEKIKRVFTIGDANRDVVLVGKEPDRAYLTEPPRGFRSATKTTAVTREGGYEREDPADAGKYYRDQAKRNSEYR